MGQISLEKSFDYFLKNDFTEYKEDEWVAICGEKIVASGYDLKEVIKENQESVESYKAGKLGALNVLLGVMMKKTLGKADANKAKKILERLLKLPQNKKH